MFHISNKFRSIASLRSIMNKNALNIIIIFAYAIDLILNSDCIKIK